MIVLRVNRVAIIHAQTHVWQIHADQMHFARYQIIVPNARASTEWYQVQQQKLAAFVHQHRRAVRIVIVLMVCHVFKTHADQFVLRTQIA